MPHKRPLQLVCGLHATQKASTDTVNPGYHTKNLYGYCVVCIPYKRPLCPEMTGDYASWDREAFCVVFRLPSICIGLLCGMQAIQYL